MKIVADQNIPLAREFFSSLGEVSLVTARDLSPSKIKEADALIVRSTVRISKALLTGSKVKFVGTCTAGDDHFDKGGMESLGIQYYNAPGCNAESVVEYVFSSLLALGKDWRGSSIGIIGRGNVGGLLYEKMTSLGANCCCYDPFLDTDTIPDLHSLEEVLKSEIICCHAPLTKDGEHSSFHLLGETELENLGKNTVLISAGRGAVIDNAALLNILKRRSDLKVVLDVWEGEPDISEELLTLVDYGTPHIAGHSYDGKVKGTALIYQRLCQFLGREPEKSLADLENPVDSDSIELSSHGFLDGIQEAIQKVYDVRVDAEHFKRSIADKKNVPSVFDTLRKQYPMRREFQKYKVKMFEPNRELADALQSLGFKSVE